MDALKQDLACLVRALSCANQEAQEAKAAFVAASACLNACNPSTEAMPAAPAAHRNYEASPFQQEMASALITHFGQNTDAQKQYQQHASERKQAGLSPLNLADWVMYALRARENRAAPAQAQAPQQSEAATDPLAPPPAAQPPHTNVETTLQNGGNDTRLSSRQQQLHPKAATLEASSTSSHARLAEQAARTTKEERERLFEASRKDEVPNGEQPLGS